MTQQGSYKLPSTLENQQGKVRKVGFELEFTGLDLNQAIAVVEKQFATTGVQQSIAEGLVSVADLGDFSIELDWHYLKEKATQPDRSNDDWLDLLSQAATLLVPIEVVCPPLPVTDLGVLDPLVENLRRAGAGGTEDSLIAAYGVHINAEIPDLDAPHLYNYLRAFSLLQWWLVDDHQVDFSRRLSPFVDLYPEAYVKLLLERREPDLQVLMNDYLYYNASRNRALDLLPLLAEIDATRVGRAVTDVKVKARPAFHYRLPNCQIDKPGWSLAAPWNTWWVVEELAQQPGHLDQLAHEFLSHHRPLLGVSRGYWTEFIDQWLKNHKLA